MANINYPKFFIVDDDPFCRMLYHRHLLNLGYTDNHLFDNGQDCINQLSHQPDIIFLDYDMAPQNGLDIVKKVKKLYPNIHLLVISSRMDEQVAINVKQSGAFDYIIKGERDLEAISRVINHMLISKAVNN